MLGGTAFASNAASAKKDPAYENNVLLLRRGADQGPSRGVCPAHPKNIHMTDAWAAKTPEEVRTRAETPPTAAPSAGRHGRRPNTLGG